MNTWLLLAVRLSARLILVSLLAACWAATAQTRAPIPEGYKSIGGPDVEVVFTRSAGQAARSVALAHASEGHRRVCEDLHKKPLIIENGYIEKVGTSDTYMYKSKNAVTTISTTWDPKYLNGSPCHHGVEARRMWITAIFDGTNTRITTYYIDRGVATARTVAGRSPELALTPVTAHALVTKSTARLVGTREFASMPCNLWEPIRIKPAYPDPSLGDTVSQLCATGKPKWPPDDGSFGLYFKMGPEFQPTIESTVVQILPVAAIGNGIFSPPIGTFKLNEAKTPVVVEEPDEEGEEEPLKRAPLKGKKR